MSEVVLQTVYFCFLYQLARLGLFNLQNSPETLQTIHRASNFNPQIRIFQHQHHTSCLLDLFLALPSLSLLPL